MLEDVGAVDGVGRLWGDGKAFDDVAVTDVFGVRRKAALYEERSEEWKAALQPEGGTGIEVEPGFRCAHATAKLHVRLIHRPYYYIGWKSALRLDSSWLSCVGELCVIA